MLVSLDTPYVDTCAADLSLALGGPERPALHIRDVTLPGGVRLRLRLLGASHQVVLTTPTGFTTPAAPTGLADADIPTALGAPAASAGLGTPAASTGPGDADTSAGWADATGPAAAGGLVETVACLPGRPPHLPGDLHDEAGGYRFTATVLRPAEGELHTRIAALRADLADDPYALVGVFPGDPDAVTALAVRPDAPDGTVGWRTWHAYPQTNELVLTETVVDLLRAPQSRTRETP
ncbi:DUF2617 family protein [Micromonospora sp. NPDC049081]|uniref:DUF2617 family protein n=1 Tax=Micromonospora sp. NPDC049081 TaxID=3155150 RepID=UPI0033E83BB8